MVAEHPPSGLRHNISFTGSFLTQPSSREVDAALSDHSSQNVYNPKPRACSDVAFPDDASIREYYEEIRRLRTSNCLWGYPLGHTLELRLFLHASGQMNKEQEMRFCGVLMELDRQRVAHRRMAEDLGLWTAPAEGEVMSAHDKWMLPLLLHRKESPMSEMRDLGLNSCQISMYTFTSPPYIDARMWLEHRFMWKACDIEEEMGSCSAPSC